MPETEADTCRKYILPKLHEVGWTDVQINEQHPFTDGRVIPTARRVRRGPQKRAAGERARNRAVTPMEPGL